MLGNQSSHFQQRSGSIGLYRPCLYRPLASILNFEMGENLVVESSSYVAPSRKAFDVEYVNIQAYIKLVFDNENLRYSESGETRSIPRAFPGSHRVDIPTILRVCPIHACLCWDLNPAGLLENVMYLGVFGWVKFLFLTISQC